MKVEVDCLRKIFCIATKSLVFFNTEWTKDNKYNYLQNLSFTVTVLYFTTNVHCFLSC